MVRLLALLQVQAQRAEFDGEARRGLDGRRVYGERSARHEGDVAGMVAAWPAQSWDDGDSLVFDVV